MVQQVSGNCIKFLYIIAATTSSLQPGSRFLGYPFNPFRPKHMLSRTVATFIPLLLVATVSAGPGGTVSGKVVLPTRSVGRIPVEKYTGSISGKVAAPPTIAAGVWVEGPGIVLRPTAAAAVTLRQEGYQFAKSILIVPRGTTLLFPNDDPDYHNVYSLSRGARFDLGRYKRNEATVPEFTFTTCGLVRLQCEIHQHMRANVLVVESPYCALTGPDGSFTLTGLPTGSHMLRVQLDEKTQWHAVVTISDGVTVHPLLIPGAPVSTTKS
jgi:plastocyanin